MSSWDSALVHGNIVLLRLWHGMDKRGGRFRAVGIRGRKAAGMKYGGAVNELTSSKTWLLTPSEQLVPLNMLGDATICRGQ